MSIESTLPHGLHTSDLGSLYKAEYDQNLNLLDINRITTGPIASRPAFGVDKRFWFDPTTKQLSFDDGTQWIEDVTGVVEGNLLTVESASAINQDVTTDASPIFTNATIGGVNFNNFVTGGSPTFTRLHVKTGGTGAAPTGDTIAIFENSVASNTARISIKSATNGLSILDMGDSTDNGIQRITSNNPNNTLSFYTNNTEVMQIGMLGASINSSVNTAPLTVLTVGSSTVSNSSATVAHFVNNIVTSASADIRISSGITGSSGIIFKASGIISYNASNDMLFKTNLSEQMRITSAGMVGIGTFQPFARLHLMQPNDTTALLRLLNFSASSSLSDGFAFLISNDNVHSINVTSPGNTGLFQITWAGFSRLVIQPNGDTWIRNENASLLMKLTNSGAMIHKFNSLEPTGGFKGIGTLNAGGLYDDGSLLTCYVIEAANTGIVDLDFWKSVDPAGKHVRAVDFVENRMGSLDLDIYSNFWKMNSHLPSMPSKNSWVHNSYSVGDFIGMLWETVEIQAVHINKLNERLRKLEGE